MFYDVCLCLTSQLKMITSRLAHFVTVRFQISQRPKMDAQTNAHKKYENKEQLISNPLIFTLYYFAQWLNMYVFYIIRCFWGQSLQQAPREDDNLQHRCGLRVWWRRGNVTAPDRSQSTPYTSCRHWHSTLCFHPCNIGPC